HLAISPPFLSSGWQGNLCLRAGAQRLDSSRIPVRLWLGLPASPQAAPPGMRGETAVTWAMPRGLDSLAPGWPDGWPRWAVLRVREGREPQALWELPALWRACTGPAPEAEVASSVSPSPGTLRLAVDIGSTSTVIVEEDSAAAGSVGAKLLAHGSLLPTPSGFRRLAGAAAHATPLAAPEGGRWTLRRPRLTSAVAILTYPECAFDTGAAQPFSAVFEQAGLQLCRGLAAAWEQASHRLVADPAAARAARAH